MTSFSRRKPNSICDLSYFDPSLIAIIALQQANFKPPYLFHSFELKTRSWYYSNAFARKYTHVLRFSMGDYLRLATTEVKVGKKPPKIIHSHHHLCIFPRKI